MHAQVLPGTGTHGRTCRSRRTRCDTDPAAVNLGLVWSVSVIGGTPAILHLHKKRLLLAMYENLTLVCLCQVLACCRPWLFLEFYGYTGSGLHLLFLTSVHVPGPSLLQDGITRSRDRHQVDSGRFRQYRIGFLRLGIPELRKCLDGQRRISCQQRLLVIGTFLLRIAECVDEQLSY